MLTRHPLLSAAGIPMLLVSLVTASCSGSSVPTADPTRPGEGSPGAQLFVAACASCHGLRGDGGPSGVPLNRSAADRQRIVGAIRYGIGGMPASSAGMSDEEINALAEYVAGLH